MIVLALLLTCGVSCMSAGTIVLCPRVVDWLFGRRHYCAKCADELVNLGQAKTRRQIEESILYETREP